MHAAHTQSHSRAVLDISMTVVNIFFVKLRNFIQHVYGHIVTEFWCNVKFQSKVLM